jgi:SpoVK/Ycf46/Vps4 family AAA+-type ATPase
MLEDAGTEQFGTNIPVDRDDEVHLLVRTEEPTEAIKQEGEPKFGMTQWEKTGEGMYLATGHTQKVLPSGAYSIDTCNRGILFVPQNIKSDELIQFEDSQSNDIITEIKKFWALEEQFKKYGFLHRRGYILFGPAGGGKSSLVRIVLNDVVEKDGVVFFCNTHPRLFNKAMYNFRQVEPNRNIVCIFEDIDSIIREHGDEDLLQFLDGEVQINKCLSIATTNYPEKLDPRIISRPRRFDRRLCIKMPTANMRRDFFKKKLSIEDDEIKNWVDKTAEFSFAALAELVISVKCLGNDFEESVKILKDLAKKKETSEDFDGTSKIGF